MANEPITTITGNLTRDPEIKFTPAGQPVASFTIATTPRIPDAETGKWRDGETWFVRCSAWGQLGENICESLSKGAAVVASGRLRARTWETDDGTRRAAVEMTVDQLGPSLRHHIAKLIKVTREAAPTVGGTTPAAGSGNAWETAPAGPEPASPADGWPDEPPF